MLDECEELLARLCGWSLRTAIHGNALESNDTAIVQPAIFSMQAALGELCALGESLPISLSATASESLLPHTLPEC